MPMYEFFCEACQKKTELLMKFSDPLPTECPSCGKGPFRKLLSQTAFILKGGGWYSEGYGSGKKSENKESSSANETKTETKVETKSDTKSCASPTCGVKH